MQFTIKDAKKQATKPAMRPMGRAKGSHLKQIDMEQFITEHDCLELAIEHDWLIHVKLYENIFLRDTLAKSSTNKATDTAKWSIELSTALLNGEVGLQREMFIKAACNLISIRMFGYGGGGQVFQLLVDRYLHKVKKPSIIDQSFSRVN